MATPQVTGIAALILSVTPDLPALDLLQQIKSTVDLKTSLTYKVTTGGRVNAFRALTEGLTIPWPTIASVAVADGGNANGVVNPGEPVTLTVSIRNVSTIAATGLNATLSLAAPDSFVTLGTTAASLGTLAPFETKDAVLTLSVAANTPTPHVVNLHLTTTDSANNTRILPLTFTVYTQSAVTGTVRDVLGVPVAGPPLRTSGFSPARPPPPPTAPTPCSWSMVRTNSPPPNPATHPPARASSTSPLPAAASILSCHDPTSCSPRQRSPPPWALMVAPP